MFGTLELILSIVGIFAATVLVLYVTGKITRAKLKDKMIENDINSAVIEHIDTCTNCVSVKDLFSDTTLEIHGDSVDSNLTEGERIHV